MRLHGAPSRPALPLLPAPPLRWVGEWWVVAGWEAAGVELQHVAPMTDLQLATVFDSHPSSPAHSSSQRDSGKAHFCSKKLQQLQLQHLQRAQRGPTGASVECKSCRTQQRNKDPDGPDLCSSSTSSFILFQSFLLRASPRPPTFLSSPTSPSDPPSRWSLRPAASLCFPSPRLPACPLTD